MKSVEFAPVSPDEQLRHIELAVGDCVALAVDFFRMGQPGRGVPEHYTNPQMETRTIEGRDYGRPVMNPLTQTVYRVGSLCTPPEVEEKSRGLDIAAVNRVFGAATSSFVGSFDPAVFGPFVDGQPPKVAQSIREAGAHFIEHWSSVLLRYTTDPVLIRQFMDSPLFQRLHRRAGQVGDPLSTRLVSHIVRLEGSGIAGERSTAYSALLQHVEARMAQAAGDDSVVDALGLVAWHTPTEIPGLLDQEATSPTATAYTSAYYRFRSIEGILRRIGSGVAGDHVMVLEELSNSLRATADGCAGLLTAYNDLGVLPPAELLGDLQGHLDDSDVLAGPEGSYSHGMRQEYAAMLTRAHYTTLNALFHRRISSAGVR